MTAAAPALQLRRGACPGLSAPMPTGDGLLVRLQPIGTIALAAFAALCAAARRHGNGIVEVTSRGNIQVRGLSDRSAPHFAADVAALGIAADDGVPVLCNPLSGIDADEIFDGAALAAELRRALARTSLASKLNAKVSIVIDSGGAFSLAKVFADVRLCAQTINGEVTLRVAVGGDGRTATDLGIVVPAHGVEAAVRLLEIIARHGRARRARDVIAWEGDAAFRAALAETLLPVRPGDPPTLAGRATADLSPPKRASAKAECGGLELDSRLRGNERDVVDIHALRDESFAKGVGFAFGHSDATALEQLAEAARHAGAAGFRAAPRRALLAIGLPRQTTFAFATAAEKLGFIVRADDPRRRIVACAGAPICGSAFIAARAIAPGIAADVAPLLETAATIHVSGCAKGCAHPGPAALTVVGTPGGCALIADGAARDAPFAHVAARDLSAAITRFAQARIDGDGHV